MPVLASAKLFDMVCNADTSARYCQKDVCWACHPGQTRSESICHCTKGTSADCQHVSIFPLPFMIQTQPRPPLERFSRLFHAVESSMQFFVWIWTMPCTLLQMMMLRRGPELSALCACVMYYILVWNDDEMKMIIAWLIESSRAYVHVNVTRHTHAHTYIHTYIHTNKHTHFIHTQAQDHGSLTARKSSRRWVTRQHIHTYIHRHCTHTQAQNYGSLTARQSSWGWVTRQHILLKASHDFALWYGICNKTSGWCK